MIRSQYTLWILVALHSYSKWQLFVMATAFIWGCKKSCCSRSLLSYLFSVACRLDTKYPICNMFKLFMCAVCQLEMKPGEGVSIHAGPSNTKKLRPWDGPFLCTSCQEKKEAMEGRRPSGGTKPLIHMYFVESCGYKPYCFCYGVFRF